MSVSEPMSGRGEGVLTAGKLYIPTEVGGQLWEIDEDSQTFSNVFQYIMKLVMSYQRKSMAESKVITKESRWEFIEHGQHHTTSYK